MTNNILKIDIDCKFKFQAISILIERLSYMQDLKFFDSRNILKIELIKKTNYGCRIYLDKGIQDVCFLVLVQTLLGSDYRKEINTYWNYMQGYQYYNRMFLIKRYKSNKIILGKVYDVTDIILNQVLDENRNTYKK